RIVCAHRRTGGFAVEHRERGRERRPVRGPIVVPVCRDARAGGTHAKGEGRNATHMKGDRDLKFVCAGLAAITCASAAGFGLLAWRDPSRGESAALSPAGGGYESTVPAITPKEVAAWP